MFTSSRITREHHAKRNSSAFPRSGASARRCCRAGARPRDAIEELLARDVIDLSWEILRLRRIKMGVLKASMYEGVAKVMEDLGYEETMESSKAWAAGDKRAKEQVTRALAKANLSMDEVTATTLQIN